MLPDEVVRLDEPRPSPRGRWYLELEGEPVDMRAATGMRSRRSAGKSWWRMPAGAGRVQMRGRDSSGRGARAAHGVGRGRGVASADEKQEVFERVLAGPDDRAGVQGLGLAIVKATAERLDVVAPTSRVRGVHDRAPGCREIYQESDGRKDGDAARSPRKDRD